MTKLHLDECPFCREKPNVEVYKEYSRCFDQEYTMVKVTCCNNLRVETLEEDVETNWNWKK